MFLSPTSPSPHKCFPGSSRAGLSSPPSSEGDHLFPPFKYPPPLHILLSDEQLFPPNLTITRLIHGFLDLGFITLADGFPPFLRRALAFFPPPFSWRRPPLPLRARQYVYIIASPFMNAAAPGRPFFTKARDFLFFFISIFCVNVSFSR